MKAVLISLSVIGWLVFSGPVSAQTWTQTGAPSTNWQFIAASANGTKLVALNNLYGIYASTNSGATWQKATNGPVFIGGTQWSGLAGSADGVKWVATAYWFNGAPGNGGIFISTNSGVGWTQTTNFMLLAGAACSAGGSTMFASGYAIYKSTNSGLTWIPATTASVSWGPIAVAADGQTVINATYGQGTYVSTNSGATWSSFTGPNTGWLALAASADARKLVAVSSASAVYTSTNAGATWGSNNLPTAVWWATGSSSDGSRLVTVATNGWIYASTNSGATWYSNSVPSNHWSAVASSADGCKWTAAVNGGGIYATYIPPRPWLSFSASNNSLGFSWTAASTNLVLQQNASLGKANWVRLTNVAVLNFTNLQYQITLPSTGSTGFYRLTTP